MTTPVLDAPLLRLAPAAPVALAPELVRARDSIEAGLTLLGSVPDTALERPWHWRDGELDVRSGLYRQYEELEDSRALVALSGAQAKTGESVARPLVAAATAARWDLHGLLAGLADADLDRDPGNAEWTVRQTLAHIISGQRAYAWFTAWWMDQHITSVDDLPASVPDDAIVGVPEEEEEGRGSLAQILRRLDDLVDLSAGVFGPLGAADLAARARWAGRPVDVRFRMVRWSSHMREHTIQVEKTLGYIGHELTEVERLVRLTAAAYGRLEAELFMFQADRPDIAEALTLTESAAARVATGAASVAQAAHS